MIHPTRVENLLFFNVVLPIAGGLASVLAYPELKKKGTPKSLFISAIRNRREMANNDELENNAKIIEKNPLWLNAVIVLFLIPLVTLTLTSIFLLLNSLFRK